ncbi:MAG: thioredoxin family protein [Candidatus Aenigmarchaeota archaeon]|nr:thioredoxin family protein [Candidatus Aenigmarchaeota archaeon]
MVKKIKHRIDWSFYIITFFITSTIFFLGIYIGIQLNEAKVTSITLDIESLDRIRELQGTNMLLLEILGEKKCIALETYITTIIPEIEKLGSRVVYYENSADSRRYNIKEYYQLKRDYILFLIRYWTLTKKLERECKQNIPDLIYFYSNKKCKDCKKQGIILDEIKKENPDILIFPIDVDLNLSTVDILTTTFNITEVPSLLIDGRPYLGFRNKDEIEKLLRMKR